MVTKQDMRTALVQAVIVLAPTYTVAWFTEAMVYTIPMLAASSFVAAALKPTQHTTKVDDVSKDGGEQ